MVASIQIDGVHSRDQLGENKKTKPYQAPVKNSPLSTNRANITKGVEAVTIMILPDVLAPFLMTRWQTIKEQI